MRKWGFCWKLSVGLFVVAVVWAVTVGIYVISRQAYDAERRVQQRNAAYEREVELRYDMLGNRILTDLLSVQARLLDPRSEVIELAADSSTRSSTDVVLAAGRLTENTSLQVLQLMDGDLKILSSAHWPEQAGEKWDGPGCPSEMTCLVPLDSASGSHTTVLRCIRMSRPEGEGLHLCGGVILDRALLETLSGGHPATISRNGPSAGTSRSVSVRLHGAPEWVLHVTLPELEAPILDEDTKTLIVGLVLLAVIVTTVVWISIYRSLSRPLEQMTRAIEAVTAGEEDYTFPASRRDESQELVQTISRMRRSLDFQQDRLRAVERVAAWREAARRVAHEVKNPLVPISLTVENLTKAKRNRPELFDKMFDEGTAAILEEVQRLRRIVTEFGEYARMPAPELELSDLDEVVDSVVALYDGRVGVGIDRKKGGVLPPVALDRDLIGRAVGNLVKNAIEAVPADRGRIDVETCMEEGMAVVTVSDNGPGLSPEQQAHIFEPYFTTKTGGTGLGMAVTHRIVTEHGGVVTAGNNDEGGARISFRLPVEIE